MTGWLRTSAVALAIAAGLIALAPATWWITIALPDEAETSPDPDYLFRPVQLDQTVATAIGWMSIVVAVVGLSLFVRSVRGGHVDRRWWKVIAPLGALAAYAGLTYRVITGPVIGANIGGGGLLLATPLVAIALLATAGYQAHKLRS